MSAFVGLICAVLASLSFGVLAAYGVCVAFFRMIRMMGGRREQVRAVRAAIPVPSQG